MEAIRRFDGDTLRTALESWAWVGLEGKTPLFTSPFGDVFLQGSDGVWFLDRLEGALTREWASTEELQGVLNTPEGQDRYLLLGLAVAAHETGLVPGPTELYEFRLPPVLGAPVDVSNIQVMDMTVALHLSGQLHEQVKDLPPGTEISGFTYDGDTP
ncbi:hypothetical protein P0Y31_01595 [Knoellia sp. 3-2P3]|uniref:hypothetical protein n=1 Tax=unclassified Knoellia TaxID=2618719 RepID=UPI0023DCD40F|nr:hypothetical protein [Knoellia sp. 3-2P3]MDF2091025.1 hypothetical protein [Knoellia sp. 3-2P3]